jgi:hypothetical protein
MAQTNAERQRTWRERHRGEPRGNKTLMAKLTAPYRKLPPSG